MGGCSTQVYPTYQGIPKGPYPIYPGIPRGYTIDECRNSGIPGKDSRIIFRLPYLAHPPYPGTSQSGVPDIYPTSPGTTYSLEGRAPDQNWRMSQSRLPDIHTRRTRVFEESIIRHSHTRVFEECRTRHIRHSRVFGRCPTWFTRRPCEYPAYPPTLPWLALRAMGVSPSSRLHGAESR